jgi:hypothetical protein
MIGDQYLSCFLSSQIQWDWPDICSWVVEQRSHSRTLLTQQRTGTPKPRRGRSVTDPPPPPVLRPFLPRAADLAPPQVMDDSRPRRGSGWLTAKVEPAGGRGLLFDANRSRSSTLGSCWIQELRQFNNRTVDLQTGTQSSTALLSVKRIFYSKPRVYLDA